MDDCEEEVVRELQVELVKRLDPTEYVLDYLLQQEALTELNYDRIMNAENRIEMNRALLDVVKRKKLISLFIKALEYRNSHTGLALTLRRRINEIKQRKLIKGNDIGSIQRPIVFEIKDKINKLTTKIECFFKDLCHKGDLSRFQRIFSFIRSKYSHSADIQFCLLQVEIAKSRVFYQAYSGQQDKLRGMESIIPYTTNPHACSMVYLARKGSTAAMSGDLHKGLGYLQLARNKVQFVKPCKDTGMVLYIHINLLFEVYERHPTSETREEIIRNISEAIFHFSHESPSLKEDYTRLFYLKMVFCYLGIGVFCGRIDCPVTEEDLKAAESCLTATKSVQGKFDNRRHMLYCVARSVLCRHRGCTFKALKLAREAETIARMIGFEKELSSIRELLKSHETEAVAEEERIEDVEEDLLQDLKELEQDSLLPSIPSQLETKEERCVDLKPLRNISAFVIFLCLTLTLVSCEILWIQVHA